MTVFKEMRYLFAGIPTRPFAILCNMRLYFLGAQATYNEQNCPIPKTGMEPGFSKL